MKIGMARQVSRVDLGDRADHQKLPLGTLAGHAVEQRQIDALVDDAGEAEARPGFLGLVGMV